MEKIVPISLEINFTPNTLGCYGLKNHKLKAIYREAEDTVSRSFNEIFVGTNFRRDCEQHLVLYVKL